MKNLLIYISPEHKFNPENEKYVKIQIENSLSYWDTGDILLVTNFDYEYRGVKSLIVPDDLYSHISSCVVKINVIVYLLEYHLLNDLAWFHDTEAWQVAPLDLKLDKELGLTDYGWSPRWNGGSIFFQPSTLDIFKWWQRTIYDKEIDDEKAMIRLTSRNFKNINSRIQRLNITYNLGKRHVAENLIKADKPVKVLHFHPYRENLLDKFKHLLPDNLSKLMYDFNYRS